LNWQPPVQNHGGSGWWSSKQLVKFVRTGSVLLPLDGDQTSATVIHPMNFSVYRVLPVYRFYQPSTS